MWDRNLPFHPTILYLCIYLFFSTPLNHFSSLLLFSFIEIDALWRRNVIFLYVLSHKWKASCVCLSALLCAVHSVYFILLRFWRAITIQTFFGEPWRVSLRGKKWKRRWWDDEKWYFKASWMDQQWVEHLNEEHHLNILIYFRGIWMKQHVFTSDTFIFAEFVLISMRKCTLKRLYFFLWITYILNGLWGVQMNGIEHFLIENLSDILQGLLEWMCINARKPFAVLRCAPCCTTSKYSAMHSSEKSFSITGVLCCSYHLSFLVAL